MHNVNSKEGSIQIIQHQRRDLGLLSFNLGVPEQPPAVSGIRRGPGPRWTDRRVAYALDGPGLTRGRIQE